MRSSRRSVAALAVVVLALVALVGTSAAQAKDPTVTIDRTGTTLGEEMVIKGAGWSPGSELIVELCGQGGLRGTVDCDVAHQRTAGVAPDSTFATPLTTGAVPTPCPCVVKVTDQRTNASATGAIAVAGIPTVPIDPASLDLKARRVSVTALAVSGSGPWTSLFGASPRRTLRLTVRNTGKIAIAHPSVTLAWGRGANPTRFLPIPNVPALEPGQSTTLTVPVKLDAPSFGRYSFVADVQGLGKPVHAQTHTSVYPWGLFGVGLVVLQLLLLKLRNTLRRRIQRQLANDPEVTMLEHQPVLALPAVAPAVIDLTIAAEDADEAAADSDEGQPERTVVLAGTAPAEVIDLDLEAEIDAEMGAVDDVELERMLTDHRDATAGLAVGLLRSFTAETEALRDDVSGLQQQARLGLRRANDLSASLIAAASARAKEMEAVAAANTAAAREHFDDSLRVLERARVIADELVAAAATAADELVLAAGQDRTSAAHMLGEAEAERRRLFEEAERSIAAVSADIEQRANELGERSEAAMLDLLNAAVRDRHEMRHDAEHEPELIVETVAAPDQDAEPTAATDELGRRISRAVSRALNT